MNRPYIFCHMALALDGRINGPFMSSPKFKPPGDFFDEIAFGKTRYYKHTGWLSGRATTEQNFTDYAKPELDENAAPVPDGDYIAKKADMYYVSVDTSGKIGWKQNYISWYGNDAHVIEILTGRASNAYKALLRKLGISYIICGDDELDYEAAVEKLHDLFDFELLMLGGGGTLNWSFVERGLCDEMSIVIAPVADGSSEQPSLFESRNDLSTNTPVTFTLQHVEQTDGGGLWLRYLVDNARK